MVQRKNITVLCKMEKSETLVENARKRHYFFLLDISRIIQFVFDLKYLSQNSINFNMLRVFWNPQDAQVP